MIQGRPPAGPRTLIYRGRLTERDPVVAPAARGRDAERSADGSPPNPVEALDDWAKHIWRRRRTSLWVLIALPLWVLIRIFYRGSRIAGAALYVLSRPFVWVFWRLYEVFGPLARVLKWLYWGFLYPIIELIGKVFVKIYWRVYTLCGPLARLIKRFYWTFAFPVIELPARLLGFSLTRSTSASVGDRVDQPSPQREDSDIRGAFAAGMREEDTLVWIAHTLDDFDALFDCLPRFGLTRPTPAALFLWLTPQLAEEAPKQLRLLGLRLRSGAPCSRIHLCAPDARTATTLEQSFDAPVEVVRGCDAEDFVQLVLRRDIGIKPALTLTHFGPVVLLISALWGRVGSTLVFDAQTQFLIENGAIVVRVFVDHNPERGHSGHVRENGLIRENLTATRPHLLVISRRDQDAKQRSKVHARPDYRKRSAIRRYELELEGAIASDAAVLVWAGAAARLSIVNHAMHMAFAERISAAPIVLETHDVLTHQLESHGWPKFVSHANEPKALRDSDQHDMWRRAAACVNLSPEDHTEIALHARVSKFVRPIATSSASQTRPWPDVVRANALSTAFAANESIDVLLWGDWHEGNARAVKWFFEQVRGAHPVLQQARIGVIGRVTRIIPASFRALPNVVMADFVDTLHDFFARSKVLVIADQEGSGVSIKAIEVMSRGQAFASTRVGLRGLEIGSTGYRPADTAADLAADLVSILQDTAARSRRADIARDLYDLNISHDKYEADWRDVIAQVEPTFPTANEALFAAAPAASTSGPAHFMELCRPPPSHGSQPASAVAPPPMLMRRAKHALAAVICTYNRYDVLPGAIQSLLHQDIDPDDLDILVIDNSPDQGAAAEFGATYAGTRVRYLLEPIPGLSNARNVGAEACTAKFVAYIDDDAVAAPDWARKLLAGLHKFSPKAGVAGGRIIPRWITPRPDWLPDELIGNLSIVDWGGLARVLGKTEWVAGCNVAFERNALLDLGGFSRALGRVGAGAALLSNEESEVIEKFASAGRSTIYVPEATVEHLIEPARLSQEWFRRRAAWQAVSDYIKDPKKAASYAGAAKERLRRELLAEHNTLPPGFMRPESEREQFRHEVGLMYDVVIAMLAGGVELDENGTSSASLQDKLLATVRRELQRNPQLRSTIRKLSNI